MQPVAAQQLLSAQRAPQVNVQSPHLLKGPFGPPEVVVRPQAARESNKFFWATLVVMTLWHGGRELSHCYLVLIIEQAGNEFYQGRSWGQAQGCGWAG